MPGVAAPQIKYSYDPETRDWGFVVKRPHVIGGGDSTLAAAERHATSAIAFALRVEREERRARASRAPGPHPRRAG